AKIAQSSTLPPVADEPASPIRDVSQGEACSTDSGFIVDHDRANISKTSTLPHESTSRVTSLAADEGSLQLCFQELTDFCTSLQRQQSELVSKFEAQALEITELKARVKFLEDRQGEGINLFGDDAPIKGRRLDEEEVATERVSSDIRLDKGEVSAERVCDDTEEMATVLITIDAASVLSSGGVQVVPTTAAVAPANVITPYTKRKGKEKMVETHTPKKKKRLQEQIDIQFARELEEELEREAQRMNAQITRDEEIAKIHIEKELQQMIEGTHRGTKKLLEDYKVRRQLSNYQFFMDMLKQIDREDLNQLWALVKETLSVRPTTDEKEMKLWVELKRLYEPDVKDYLWTHTQHIMHAHVEWRFYDTCGVHHVMFKDLEIFMLVEKN
nr:hypothetical protein [Tanacetum cinerariifolium]